jgi:hypothetical protein
VEGNQGNMPSKNSLDEISNLAGLGFDSPQVHFMRFIQTKSNRQMAVMFKHSLTQGVYLRRNRRNWHHRLTDLFNADPNIHNILVFEGGLTLVQDYSAPWPPTIERIRTVLDNLER